MWERLENAQNLEEITKVPVNNIIYVLYYLSFNALCSTPTYRKSTKSYLYCIFAFFLSRQH